jgi:hypothetical protein
MSTDGASEERRERREREREAREKGEERRGVCHGS